jgi:sugar phosphate isomerase/epimerase
MAGAAALPSKADGAAAPADGPGFHLGSVTYNLLKDLDVESIIRVLEGARFEAVELRTTHRHGVEPSIGREERARVRGLFEKSKVRLVSYGTTCRFQSPDAAERAKQLATARQFVDLARDTGAIGIKIQPMEFPAEVPVAATIGNFGSALRELGDYGSSQGVEIWMEVHARAADPPTAAAIMRSAGHKNVGLCWNSNPEDVVNGSVKQSFELLKPWIRSVHINELANDRYPWSELFALLRGAGYNRYTFAEVAESKELDRFLRWYRALWTEMNRT